jgi:uncharacterized membrane protein
MTERNIKWALIISLLVNVLFVGFLIGTGGRGGLRPMMAPIMRAFDNSGRGGPDRRNELDKTRADQPTRKALRDTFQAERPAINKALQNLRQARAKGAELIRAETLDAAALDAALAQIRLSNDAVTAVFHRALTASTTKLDANQRRGLARQLDRASGMWGLQLRGPGGPGDPGGRDAPPPPPPPN